MHYRPVVDRFVEIPALGPIWFMLFVAAFIAITLLARKRPLYGLLALIATAPFGFAHAVAHTTVTLPKVALLAVILGLCAHRTLFARLRAREVRAWLLAFSAVAAATLLSITQATYLAPALRESLKALEALAVFAAAVVASDESEALERLALPVFAAVATLVALLALLEVIIGAPSGLNIGTIVLPRIAGPLDGPNQLAGFLEIAIAVLVAAQLARPRRYLAWALTAALLAEILTLSRAGIVLSVGIVALLAFLRPQHLRATIAPLAGAFLLALFFAFVAVLGNIVGGAHVANALTSMRGLLRLGHPETGTGGVGTRAELWRAAIALWRQHPWLGIGAGNYHLELGRVGLPGVRTQPNSLYLRALVDGGLPLLAATLWLWIGGTVRLARASIRSDAWAAAAFAATAALALHGVIDNLQFYPKVLAWWLLLVAIAGSQRRSPHAE
uniref:O-antigen ligase-related domain-containing protein n=1 Tax=mine drainage metagenome TaxID=410659 RepID=E6Q742_9ZZZZ